VRSSGAKGERDSGQRLFVVARRRGREAKRGGPAVGAPHGTVRLWGLALTVGRRPDRVPADRSPAAAWTGGAALF
jgi:hypothetical protein